MSLLFVGVQGWGPFGVLQGNYKVKELFKMKGGRKKTEESYWWNGMEINIAKCFFKLEGEISLTRGVSVADKLA